MQRRGDCYKYRKWKEAQTKKPKKLTEEEKKQKRKEPVSDCVDEDAKEHPPIERILKISYRKCKKKRKKKKKLSKQKIKVLVKHVSLGDLILQCIKPPIEKREHLLNPRHAVCFDISVSKLDIPSETPEVASTSKAPHRRKPCMGGKKRTMSRESKSDDSECDSICSFDSEVCLAGVKLTSKDKEEIKKYQREAQESDKKE
ncbi:hypothetical protein ANTQUA_LOCUS8816 [Anthophora quadrimaculata]